ncbi:hypothetical protein LUW74_35250 [Actinomadura madurae]|uniref:hypothetical protein n=1 Tax=Actinomadura madurae TaxID=1993 RepID=UPI00202725EA|nr:hypothetical protein [Actinomadura madurae]URN08109.1 hypothetical protein LUW74_35250 [Actinomadura madurae]
MSTASPKASWRGRGTRPAALTAALTADPAAMQPEHVGYGPAGAGRLSAASSARAAVGTARATA